jgi:hypothetical protein
MTSSAFTWRTRPELARVKTPAGAGMDVEMLSSAMAFFLTLSR